jgi:hypothetical protein
VFTEGNIHHLLFQTNPYAKQKLRGVLQFQLTVNKEMKQFPVINIRMGIGKVASFEEN